MAPRNGTFIPATQGSTPCSAMRGSWCDRVHLKEGKHCISASGTAEGMVIALVSLCGSLRPGLWAGTSESVFVGLCGLASILLVCMSPHKPYQRGKPKKQNIMY